MFEEFREKYISECHINKDITLKEFVKKLYEDLSINELTIMFLAKCLNNDLIISSNFYLSIYLLIN